MKLSLRITHIALAAALALGLASAAVADNYPSKNVTIVAPFPPGGTVDQLARVLSHEFSEDWKQSVIVENRPGASGIVGSQFVSKATPDGYTLLVVPITHVTNASLFKKLPFDPLADFTPISLIAESPIILVVNKSLPVNSVSDLIAYAKANPGKLNCGSGGNGTSQHLACELFKSMAKVDIRHVPYKGNAAAITDVIGGQIELMFDQMATAVPHVHAGKVKPLAISTLKRSPAMPTVPTINESGLSGYEMSAWFGLVGPAGMPPDVVAKIQGNLAQAIAQPAVKAQLSSLGLTLIGGPSNEFKAFLGTELGKWAKVVKDSGAQIE
jgi:tripartite-type tricarboxylate transporter receptor subunit TctC